MTNSNIDLPARLTSEQTARVLGFGLHEMGVLTSHKLLKPLGSPAPNAPKFFARVDVLSKAESADWLDKATKTLSRHWHEKNAAQRSRREEANAGPAQ